MARANRASTVWGRAVTAAGLFAGAAFLAALVAVGVLALFGGAAGDFLAGSRVLRREGGKGGTAFLFLAHRDQRLAELQHAIRSPRAVRIFLDLFRKGAGRRGIILLHIRNVAEPIHRLRGQFILWVGIGEATEGAAGFVVLGAGEKPHCRVEFRAVGA